MNSVASGDRAGTRRGALDPTTGDHDYANDDQAEVGEEFLSDVLPLLGAIAVVMPLLVIIVLLLPVIL